LLTQRRPGRGRCQQAQVPPSQATGPSEHPTSSTPLASTNPGLPGGVPTLPDLDDLISPSPSNVVLAQAHGDGVGPLIPDTAGASPSFLEFGPIDSDSSYLVTFGCVSLAGSDVAGLAIQPAGSPAEPPTATMACDGTMSTGTIDASGPSMVRLATPRLTGWRLVVRAVHGLPGSAPQKLAVPVAAPGQ